MADMLAVYYSEISNTVPNTSSKPVTVQKIMHPTVAEYYSLLFPLDTFDRPHLFMIIGESAVSYFLLTRW